MGALLEALLEAFESICIPMVKGWLGLSILLMLFALLAASLAFLMASKFLPVIGSNCA